MWLRSEHQLGLTVDDWGEGLLMLSDSAAILSTFALDEESREALAEGWSRWGPALRAGCYLTASRSTTNTSVSFGPITGGDPCGP